jgi:DNA double-strand break repair helicase HerA and related ATPase
VPAAPLQPRYAEEIDRESAREKLTAKLTAATETAPGDAESAAPAPGAARPAKAGKQRQGTRQGTRKGTRKGTRERKARANPADDGSPVVDFLKSREGRSAASAVTRGAMGVLKGFMK